MLGVSASAYYHRKTGARSRRVVEDERLLGLIRELHLANYEAYGSRKTWLALRRAGYEVGRDRVERIMRQAGIRGAKWSGSEVRARIGSGGQGGGVGFGEELVEVVAGEFPLEWCGDLLVAAREGE